MSTKEHDDTYPPNRPDSNSHMLQFHGRLQVIEFDQFADKEYRYMVNNLNESSESIGYNICSLLETSLPFKSDIRAEIRFIEGSIEWNGVLHILTWAASIGGSVGLLDYLRKITIFAINNSIKERLPSEMQKYKLDTTVFAESIAPPTSTRSENNNNPPTLAGGKQNTDSNAGKDFMGNSKLISRAVILMASILAGDAALTLKNYDNVTENTEMHSTRSSELKQLKEEMFNIRKEVVWLQASKALTNHTNDNLGMCTCVMKSNAGLQSVISCPAKNTICDTESREVCEAQHTGYEC